MNVTPLIESAAIANRVKELATEIAADYADTPLLMVGILTGAAQFMMDLLSALPEAASNRVDYDFIGVASYAGLESTGQVSITLETTVDLHDRHVLVVDGIVDSGLTLQRVLEHVGDQSPLSVKTCVLLDKPSRRQHTIGLDYAGFEIEDAFVVGYGLDADQRGRSLRYIGVLEDSKTDG